MRLISLCDCNDMGGEVIIFKTDALPDFIPKFSISSSSLAKVNLDVFNLFAI